MTSECQGSNHPGTTFGLATWKCVACGAIFIDSAIPRHSEMLIEHRRTFGRFKTEMEVLELDVATITPERKYY